MKWKILFLVLLSYNILYSCTDIFERRKKKNIEYIVALPFSLKPIKACLPYNEEEKAKLDIVLTTLEAFHGEGWMNIGAQKFLARGLYRKDGKYFERVCTPVNYYQKAAAIIDKNNLIHKYHPDRNTIRLINKLSYVNSDALRMLEGIGLGDVPLYTDVLHQDLRPYILYTLAGKTEKGAPYAQRAFVKMSYSNAIGTGAAQVAVAGGHPEALERVEEMMNEILEQYNIDDTIPYNIKFRLYELAYAIYFGGEKAHDHMTPIYLLMKHKVQSHALQFGLVDLNPTRMCDLLKLMGNPEKQDGEHFAYCDNFELYDK